MWFNEYGEANLHIRQCCKFKTNKRGRNTDENQSFINSCFVSISKDKESKISSIDKLTKYLDILRRTRCILFERGVNLCDILLDAKENIKCLSVTKTISVINESLKLIIEEWIIKYTFVVVSPISRDAI